MRITITFILCLLFIVPEKEDIATQNQEPVEGKEIIEVSSF